MQDTSDERKQLLPFEKSKMEQLAKSEARTEPRWDKKFESEMSTVETTEASIKMAKGGKKRPKKATEDEFAKGTFGFVYTLGWIGLVWVMGFGFGSGLTFLNYLRLGETPIYFGADSFIGSTPRIIYEPNPAIYDSNSHGVIEWNPNQYHDTKMLNLMARWNHVFEDYHNNSFINTTERLPCAGFDGYVDGAPVSSSCVLDLNHEDYGPCGLSKDNMKQSGMGLGDGKPCVMIRLTKLLGWYPEIDDKGEISTRECPNKEKSCCHKRRIKVECQGAAYTMYPTDGMDTCAFPFWNQKGYQAPFLMLKFNLTEPNEYKIECETNLKGLDDSQRKMKFTMKMN